jgi:hypothetical protein
MKLENERQNDHDALSRFLEATASMSEFRCRRPDDMSDAREDTGDATDMVPEYSIVV